MERVFEEAHLALNSRKLELLKGLETIQSKRGTLEVIWSFKQVRDFTDRTATCNRKIELFIATKVTRIFASDRVQRFISNFEHKKGNEFHHSGFMTTKQVIDCVSN
jgi:hypothetical protein